MKIIGIDMGKENLKVYDGTKEFKCVSTFAQGVDRLDSGYQVLLNGKKYLIGDETLEYDLDISKEKEQHRIMMYFGIAQMVDNNDRIAVVTSCPVDTFLNKDFRKSYRDFLLEQSEIIITIGTATKRFYIDKLLVVCEGAGVAYRNPNIFLNKVVGVVDIGGITTDFLFFKDMNLAREHSFSEAKGMHHLKMAIRDALKKEGCYLTTHEVKYLVSNPGEHKYLVEKNINSFIENIRRAITVRSWSSSMPLIFVGGGSETLMRQINKKFPNSTISTGCLFDNCIGNYQIGVLKWQKNLKDRKEK